MLILAFDTETTGLVDDPETKVIEVAMAMFDTDANRIVSALSTPIGDVGPDEEFDPKVVAIHGITAEWLRNFGDSPKEALSLFSAMANHADAFMARNGVYFDIPMMKRSFTKFGLEWIDRPCIDDYLDVDWPEEIKGKNLSHIAADMGFVNPFPHVAMGDVMTMLEVWKRGRMRWPDVFDWNRAMEMAQSPVVTVLSKAGYEQKDQVKEAGFKWTPDKEGPDPTFWKTWTKKMRQVKYQTESDSWGFKTVVMG